ncbi:MULTISPECIES: acyl-CoA dehydrogenase C-terminal domain-containing protein [Pseudomonas]|uniref:Acyl-CoA dehydrogenase C-terminal domain-containing protein n=1 Tax=Pseudomonas petroselini TaxID=2899822 RepID=A0ABS8QR49_9PSED|nr:MULTISPECIES: acyl-CoA dehydrogenase C-terminal domain-containing protein [Pseudomonas]MCD7037654.1 acyl-CoA dehydrogenase C-terminal domain-containing protein [Pseudomonas petroselini]MCD7046917.1 acyl-CoA dehydrogenase C-terminal domain-containing protein [Pseudomonas petroselini]MCD7066537.1 acyl-CoA dehydrogenase C-terminal domain-containing protein [Pseudomonas petroselini]MCD7080119.1 acyl-CoA dehydrogenase C-terminal domain-containing protein [Pseudomonas petroselini]MCM2380416.1 acy
MNRFQAPMRDIQFLLTEVFDGPSHWARLPGLAEHVDADTAIAILEEAAKVISGLIAPLNRSGDEEGAQWAEGKVTTPSGFKDAYATYAEGGWVGLSGNPAYGGLGMPKMLAVQIEEMLYGANSSFALYSVLSSGACLLIDTHADQELKQRYLPPMYEGRWAGSMCLTEAHAGTDLGMIRTRAELQADGSYAISGSKIFITGGEQDLTENIVHLVLAKLSDAPAGPKGISLFLVPKMLVQADGRLGPHNAVSCGSIEHKMGIKASSTCVMNFDGAIGWLVGEPNKGLAAMFTMMNYERLSIGIQGLGCAEASYQSAVSYARERLQSRAPGGPDARAHGADPIINHPDVRRMLLTMRALTEGGRALATYIGGQLDEAKYGTDSRKCAVAQRRVALLTPLAKAFFTDNGLESCVLGQQVFGGHGYIREWGQEQLVRDVRIAQIYEGTNGIQALDLLGRKILADGGAAMDEFLLEITDFANTTESEFCGALLGAVSILEEANRWIRTASNKDPRQVGAASVEYLHLFGYVSYAYLWSRMAVAAVAQQDVDSVFHQSKIKTARFFFRRLLPRIHGLFACIKGGSSSLFEHDVEQF